MKVIDLTDASLAYSTRLLADLGADVVRVEPPASDGIRRGGPPVGTGSDVAAEPAHRYFNAGKRSVALDLGPAEGRRTFVRLCAWADVVVEGYTPVWDPDPSGEALSQVNPHLVWVAVRESFSEGSGPTAGIVRWARSGLMSITGRADGPPTLVGGGLTDAVVSVQAALAAHIGVIAARRRGQGLLVRVDAFEALVSLMHQGVLQAAVAGTPPGRSGTRHGHVAVAGALPCRDGFAVVSASDARAWEALGRLIGDPRLLDDELADERARRRRSDEIFAVVGAWLGQRTRREAAETAQAAHVPIAPVQDLGDVLADPQLRARGVFHRLVDGSETAALPNPWRKRFNPAPRLGEHTEEVLRDAGLSPREIEGLAAAGIVTRWGAETLAVTRPGGLPSGDMR